jgi:hypothetical protein
MGNGRPDPYMLAANVRATSESYLGDGLTTMVAAIGEAGFEIAGAVGGLRGAANLIGNSNTVVFVPIGGVSSGGLLGKQAGAVSIGGYRIETVTNEMRAAFSGNGYLSPLDNTFKMAPVGEAMSVDHLFPSARITKMDGFDMLTKEQMTNILQDRIGLGNLQPLPSSFNSSKGAQLGWESGYKGQSLDPMYLQNLQLLQQRIEMRINNQINTYQQINRQRGP